MPDNSPLPSTTDVAILGCGPIAIDAALALSAAGRSFVVLEQGDRPAAGIRSWGTVRLFTPWSMNLSPRMQQALAAAGASVEDDSVCPTGNVFCDQALDPIAASAQLSPRLFLNTRVVAVGREHLLKREEIGTERRRQQRFRLLLATDAGERLLYANTVLDCTGGQHRPNWLGNGGIPAPGEQALCAAHDPRLLRSIGAFLATPAQPNKHTLLIGAGHSAQTAAVQLADSSDGGKVTWVLRSSGDSIAGDPEDPLPERSGLQARARVLLDGADPRFTIRHHTTIEAIDDLSSSAHRHEANDRRLRVTLRCNPPQSSGALQPSDQTVDTGSEKATEQHVLVDRIVGLVGSMGDQALYRELQVQECYATAGPMALAAALLGEAEPEGEGGSDCLAQVSQGPATLLTPEPGYFILGNKSYGRNNAFLLRIGYQQIDDVLTLI